MLPEALLHSVFSLLDSIQNGKYIQTTEKWEDNILSHWKCKKKEKW